MTGFDRSQRRRAPEPIRWDGECLELLDQRLLPGETRFEEPASAAEVFDAIRDMKVRGAPAIGISAAYDLVLAMQSHRQGEAGEFVARLNETATYLSSARPTAVNLRWALERVVRAVAVAARAPDASAERLYTAAREEAEAIHREDRALCRAIGEHGLPLIAPGCGVLTHCNAGALAVSELGTATAPLYLAREAGVEFRVFADETRPVLQGARLTAWELHEAGIDVTLICDNMAARIMAEGLVDLVIVGTDRVTANGDVVNKIGTSALAILCQHFGIPFYVACPASTFDPNTPSGDKVPIEERNPDEVRGFGGVLTAPPGVKVRNPAFDVTPHELVTAFITDKGVLKPPYHASLQALAPRS
jgi:methylthioribose-1-phosphate isomerase